MEGPLAHGDAGIGRLSEPEDIHAAVMGTLRGSSGGQLAGRTVVVTAGPTFEPIDPVRFLGNRSTGKMGIAIAAEASLRGADVILILGPGTVPPPVGVRVMRVATAEEMRTAVLAAATGADAVVMAAAVADFRPKVAAGSKLKKDQGTPDLILEPTPDILRELGEARTPGQVLVGFAAETDDVEAAGRAKLARKHVDLLVANEVGREGTGFGADTNHAAILTAALDDDAPALDDDAPLQDWTKTALAEAVMDRIAARIALAR